MWIPEWQLKRGCVLDVTMGNLGATSSSKSGAPCSVRLRCCHDHPRTPADGSVFLALLHLARAEGEGGRTGTSKPTP